MAASASHPSPWFCPLWLECHVSLSSSTDLRASSVWQKGIGGPLWSECEIWQALNLINEPFTPVWKSHNLFAEGILGDNYFEAWWSCRQHIWDSKTLNNLPKGAHIQESSLDVSRSCRSCCLLLLLRFPRILNIFPNRKKNPLSRKQRLFQRLGEEDRCHQGRRLTALCTTPSTSIVIKAFTITFENWDLSISVTVLGTVGYCNPHVFLSRIIPLAVLLMFLTSIRWSEKMVQRPVSLFWDSRTDLSTLVWIWSRYITCKINGARVCRFVEILYIVLCQNVSTDTLCVCVCIKYLCIMYVLLYTYNVLCIIIFMYYICITYIYINYI